MTLKEFTKEYDEFYEKMSIDDEYKINNPFDKLITYIAKNNGWYWN